MANLKETPPTNPPAFPGPGKTTERLPESGASMVKHFEPQDGMSLRHFFAAAALNGMIASTAIVDRTTVNKRRWAVVAFEFADAMLEEGQEPKS